MKKQKSEQKPSGKNMNSKNASKKNSLSESSENRDQKMSSSGSTKSERIAKVDDDPDETQRKIPQMD